MSGQPAMRPQGGDGASVPSRVNEGSPLLGDSYAGGNRRSGPGYPAAMGAQMDAAGGYYSGDPQRQQQQAEQLLADEAFARRLQAEQHQMYGRGDPGSPVALGDHVGGAGRQPQREQVRAAMMGELLTQRRFTQISFWLLVLLNVPQIVVITLFSVRYADKFNSCDRPLNLWLAMYGVRLIMSTVIAALPLVGPRRWPPRSESYQRLADTFNLFGFVVFILGNFWLFDSQTCRSENPDVFKLTFALVVLQYIILMLPCLLLMCLAPMVFCCLPLLIRLSLFLPAGVGLRVLDQQGASESLIAKLPPPKPYVRGMFGEEEAPPKPEAQPVAPGATSAAAAAPRPPGSPSVNHEEPECAICLSNYSTGEEVRQLPCQGAHHFHQKCCDDWLKIHATCPCCRESLLPLMADPALMRARVDEQRQRARAGGRGGGAGGGSGSSSGASAAGTSAPRPAASSPGQLRESRAESSALPSDSRSGPLPQDDASLLIDGDSRTAAAESKERSSQRGGDVHIDMPR